MQGEGQDVCMLGEAAGKWFAENKNKMEEPVCL